jgi:hypothetical protein
MDRIELIRRSLRCFTFGVLGLIPIAGLAVAGLAISEFVQVQRKAGNQWNPAGTYLFWGFVLACVSLTLPAAPLQLLAMSIVVGNLNSWF